MSNDGSAEGATWPMPKFRFEVDFGTEMKGVAFQEVSGLDTESQVVDYRKTDHPAFSTAKMPGISKYGNITLKRGVFVNDQTFRQWHSGIKMNTIQRREVVIKLLNEAGKPTMQWQLHNAWPTRITSTDMKSDGNEVAVDTLEMAHEGMTVVNS